MDAEQYIKKVSAAVRSNRQEWFPMSQQLRRKRNLRLARGIGYGLAAYDNWEDVARSTYSRIVVANSFDSTGVALDNREWMDAIREGVEGREK
jgi:hypothetical protein